LFNDSGELIINFGKKHPGKTVKQVQQQDPAIPDWIINQSEMNSTVKYHIYREHKKIKNKQRNNMSEIEKLDLTSMNVKEEQIAKLKQLFPEAFTEGDKVDWDKLKLTLGKISTW
jgi:tRNA U34 5-carboxymethylaminomethyl modifying enzyme MnmG/GidA